MKFVLFSIFKRNIRFTNINRIKIGIIFCILSRFRRRLIFIFLLLEEIVCFEFPSIFVIFSISWAIIILFQVFLSEEIGAFLLSSRLIFRIFIQIDTVNA